MKTKLVIAVLTAIAVLSLGFAATSLASAETRVTAAEKRGFDAGVAYAGRKCWYRGYFMDGDQRYDCTAAKPYR